MIMAELDRLGITYGHPGGGMYVYANVSSTGLDAETFCYELLKQEQVMVFPGTMFADPDNKHIRITLLSPAGNDGRSSHPLDLDLSKDYSDEDFVGRCGSSRPDLGEGLRGGCRRRARRYTGPRRITGGIGSR